MAWHSDATHRLQRSQAACPASWRMHCPTASSLYRGLNRGNAAAGEALLTPAPIHRGDSACAGPGRARLALELGRRALGLAGRAAGALGRVVRHAAPDLLGAPGRRPGVLGHLAGRVLDRAARAARRLRRPAGAPSA